MLDSGLTLDITKLQSFDASLKLPDAVAEWIRDRRQSQHVQKIGFLSLVSDASERKVAEQAAAVANGSVLMNTYSGYLIFDFEKSTVRRKQQNQQAMQMSFERFEEPELLEMLSHRVNRWVEPFLKLGVGKVPQSDYGFISVTPTSAGPTVATRVDEAGDPRWYLPVWSAVGTDWRLQRAGAKDSSLLFEHLLRVAFFDSQASEDLASVQRTWKIFREWKPATGEEFTALLAGLLVRADPEVRAAAAGTLGQIGGLGAGIKPMISQLLGALLEDEPQVAFRAIISLHNFPSERQVDALFRSIYYHAGAGDLIAAVIECIGSIGTESDVPRLVELHAKLSSSDRQRVDRAIAQLYDRFGLSSYDPSTRARFLELIRVFQYESATDLMAEHPTGVCQLTTYRQMAHQLVIFGRERLSLNNSGVVCTLKVLSQVAEGHEELLAIVDRLKMEMTALLMQTNQNLGWERFSLVERFHCLDVAYLRHDYLDLVSRLYNWIDDMAKYLAVVAGIELAPDRRALDRIWLRTHPSLQRILEVDKVKDKPLRLQIGALAKHNSDSPRVREASELVERFSALIREVRHEGPTGHGTQPVTRSSVEGSYGASIQEMIGDARRLYADCTGDELGENPYVVLNKDISWLLQVAGRSVPRATDLAIQ